MIRVRKKPKPIFKLKLSNKRPLTQQQRVLNIMLAVYKKRVKRLKRAKGESSEETLFIGGQLYAYMDVVNQLDRILNKPI